MACFDAFPAQALLQLPACRSMRTGDIPVDSGKFMARGTAQIQWFAVGVLCVAVAVAVAYAGSAVAATQYVSDQLSINMRSGPGNQYRIEKLLNSGDRLDTLGHKKGWTHVRTASGKKGYVLTRFLSEKPAARKRVADMEKRVDTLQSDNADLKKQLTQTQNGSDELGKRKRELSKKNKTLRNKLQDIRAASADAIRMSKQNKKYRGQIMKLRSDVERLKHENAALHSRRDGMTIGALILFGGIVLGLILPMLRRRPRRKWDSL